MATNCATRLCAPHKPPLFGRRRRQPARPCLAALVRPDNLLCTLQTRALLPLAAGFPAASQELTLEQVSPRARPSQLSSRGAARRNHLKRAALAPSPQPATTPFCWPVRRRRLDSQFGIVLIVIVRSTLRLPELPAPKCAKNSLSSSLCTRRPVHDQASAISSPFAPATLRLSPHVHVYVT